MIKPNNKQPKYQMISNGFRSKSSDMLLPMQIVKTIQNHILENNLNSGDRLPPERHLARELGVSRPTISEALGILEQNGLIERKVGRGTTVKGIMARSNVAEVVERYFLFQGC